MSINNKEKLNIALTGTAVAVAIMTGGLTLGGLITGVGANLLTDLVRDGWRATRSRWLAAGDPLNRAYARAFVQAAVSYKNTFRYHHLRPNLQQLCREGLAHLERDIQALFQEKDAAAHWFDSDPDRAAADMSHALADYFYGYPGSFLEHIQTQFAPRQLAEYFNRELQQDEKAQAAYQQLLLQTAEQQMAVLLAGQQALSLELQAVRRWLESWQAAPSEQQRAAFEAALARALDGLAEEVIAHTTDEHEKTRALIVERVQPIPTFPLDNLPAPNPHFVGRADHLQTITNHFSPSPPLLVSRSPLAITGLGGVGKSQLTLQFAHRERANYDLIWRLRVDEALAEDFLALGRALRLPVDGIEQPQAVQMVRNWLNSCPQRWLLLFDNADQTESGHLYPYLPANPHGRILITSRNPHWQARGKILRLDVFTPDEAAAFWTERLAQSQRLRQSDLTELAETLGRLPLAMEHAAAYMNSRQLDAAAYLELYRQRRQELWQRATPPDDYHATITTTWEIGFAQARQTPGAAGLLNLCCFLAPDDIPLDLLVEEADALPEELAAVLRDPLARDDALTALERYSLLERTDGRLRLHRLVQEVARDRMGQEQARVWAEAAVGFLGKVYRFDQHDMSSWVICRQLLPHLSIAIEWAEQLGVMTNRAAFLNNEAGFYLQHYGALAAARPYYERALAIREKVLGPDHPDTAVSLNNLGNLLQAMGKLAAARPYYERALAIREKALGPDHHDTAQSLNNLGGLLQAMGELAAARPYYEGALAIREKALGPDHPDTAVSLNNLGALLASIGELAAARPYYERALAIREKALGPDHPDTAVSLNNLGNLLQVMGKLAAARPYYERALAIREKALGPDHPDTALSLNNLGALLQAMGELSTTRPYYERALAIQEKALGPDHPDTAVSLNNLAVLFAYQGDFEQAVPLMRRVWSISEQKLGPNHPQTQSYRQSLANMEAELK
jgi:tetratricopeptide (TPR) repeat protein